MDSIKKKLQLIDFELDSSLNLLKKLAVKSPLFFCAIGLISGIMLEEYLSLTSLIFLVVTIASTAFTIVFFIFRKADFSPFFFAVAVTAGFLGLGGVRLNAFYQPAGNDIRHLVGSERKLATIRGMILNKPRIYRNNDWEFSKFSHSDPSSSFYLDLEQVETINSWSNVSGTIRVQVFEPVMDLKVGDYIEAYCWLSRFKEPSNPGQFDFARYLQNRGIYIGASIDSRDAISTLNKESSFFIKLKNKFSEKASIALLSDFRCLLTGAKQGAAGSPAAGL
ncbi:MAG: ComEC/Rec2 family competence protein [Planctomycetota bacterium]|jgi:hypothetical protein